MWSAAVLPPLPAGVEAGLQPGQRAKRALRNFLGARDSSTLTSRAGSLPPAPPSGRSATAGTCTYRPSSPAAPDRSAAASPPAPETRSTKTGSDSRQTPRAGSPHPKSTIPGRPHPAPPSAESTPPTPAVQPFPLTHASLAHLLRAVILKLPDEGS